MSFERELKRPQELFPVFTILRQLSEFVPETADVWHLVSRKL